MATLRLVIIPYSIFILVVERGVYCMYRTFRYQAFLRVYDWLFLYETAIYIARVTNALEYAYIILCYGQLNNYNESDRQTHLLLGFSELNHLNTEQNNSLRLA